MREVAQAAPGGEVPQENVGNGNVEKGEEMGTAREAQQGAWREGPKKRLKQRGTQIQVGRGPFSATFSQEHRYKRFEADLFDLCGCMSLASEMILASQYRHCGGEYHMLWSFTGQFYCFKYYGTHPL